MLSSFQYRPAKLASVERISNHELDEAQTVLPDATEEKALADALGESSDQDHGKDATTVKVDRNYEYAIWISYAEIYNEKVYDLLANDSNDDDNAPLPSPAHSSLPRSTAFKNLPRSTSTWRNLAALDRKSTRLNSSHSGESRMPSSA